LPISAATAFSVTACGPCAISSRRAASSAAARLSSGASRSRFIDTCVSMGYLLSLRRYSMTRAGTPADLTITPRDRRFGRGSAQARWWMGGDPVATAFYNALSATFPKGEGFFVEAVRNFREGADPKLAAEI